jgi:predicted transcriptional regulator
MERCGTTEKITHQYISILRAKNDRFVMDITKNKEAKTFQYTPKGAAMAAAASNAPAAQAAA